MEPLFSLYDIYPHLATDHNTPRADFAPYPPYDKPYDPDEVALILHSSGSTGLPKPIMKTRRVMLEWILAGENLSKGSSALSYCEDRSRTTIGQRRG